MTYFIPDSQNLAKALKVLEQDELKVEKQKHLLLQAQYAFIILEIMNSHNIAELKCLGDFPNSIPVGENQKIKGGIWFDIKDSKSGIEYTGFNKNTQNITAIQNFYNRISNIEHATQFKALNELSRASLAFHSQGGERERDIATTIFDRMENKSFTNDLSSIMKTIMIPPDYKNWLIEREQHILQQEISSTGIPLEKLKPRKI